MNKYNRLTSISNTNKVEYTYNCPIASSDLNEVQVINSSKFSSMNSIDDAGLRLMWLKNGTQAIMISDLFYNSPYSSDVNQNLQISLTNCQIRLTSPTLSSNLQYTIGIYYRLREVDSNSKLYKNGIRSSGITVNGIDAVSVVVSGQYVSAETEEIPNNIFDQQLSEEVSTRVIVELTFTLYPINSEPLIPTNTVDGAWTKLRGYYSGRAVQYFTPLSFDIDLNQYIGFLGYQNLTGPRLLNYCIMSDINLLPTNRSNSVEHALIVSSRLLMTKAGTSSWRSSPLPLFYNSGSFVRILKFIDGVSVDGEDCTGRSGYVLFDSPINYRIFVDPEVEPSPDSDSGTLTYPEYITSDGVTSVVEHSIIGPTFFSQDSSGAMADDPDGKFLLCTTIDKEIYFRNIFETNTN